MLVGGIFLGCESQSRAEGTWEGFSCNCYGLGEINDCASFVITKALAIPLGHGDSHLTHFQKHRDSQLCQCCDCIQISQRI